MGLVQPPTPKAKLHGYNIGLRNPMENSQSVDMRTLRDSPQISVGFRRHP